MKTLILIFVLLVTTCLYSTIINVPGDQPTIQEGIVAATYTDTVLVADGTYFENIDFIGKAITVASNFLIDADILHIENTIINGSQPTNPDYGSVVTFASNEDTTSVITGFTLTEGSGNIYPGFGSCGGGIVCDNSSPKVISNIVTNNSADNAGGIMLWQNSNAYLEDNIISYNTANDAVGGLLISDNSPTLEGNVIIGNSTISAQSGGVYIQGAASPVFLNCIICNNTAATYSAGLGVYAGSGTSTTILENCLIYGNVSGYNGGGLWVYDADIDVINCTISDNHADVYGGGVFVNVNGNADLVNSILWNNTPQEIYIFSGSVTATYSDIEGGWAGDGNIDEDPLFVGTGEDSYSILEDSPCIDAGIPDTTGLNLPPWDIIGNERIWDGDGDGIAIIDMGAYEYISVGSNENTIVQTKDYLHQNYPNPFNPETTINYQLPENSNVELAVYNLKGQKVKTLVNETLESGNHTVIWNGKDDNSKSVSSGIYFYKMKTGNHVETKKMILMK